MNMYSIFATEYRDKCVPAVFQKTFLSHPQWSCRCRVVELQRKWYAHMGMSPEAWALLSCRQTHSQRSHSATDHEGSLLLCTIKTYRLSWATCDQCQVDFALGISQIWHLFFNVIIPGSVSTIICIHYDKLRFDPQESINHKNIKMPPINSLQ